MPLYDENGRMIPPGTSIIDSVATPLEQVPAPRAHAAVSKTQTGPVVVPSSTVSAMGPMRELVRAAVGSVRIEPSQGESAPIHAVQSVVDAVTPSFSIGATGPIFSAAAIPIDNLLLQMLEMGEGVSDLFFIVGRPPQVESFGKLMPVCGTPYDYGFESRHLEGLVRGVIGDNQRLLQDLRETGSCDSSYALGEAARFRVNVFRQKGSFAMVLRKLNTTIPSLEDLKLPQVFRRIIQEKTGLVFVTGATGSGKTTTLAAMLNELNAEMSIHIVTLEDPVEYLHPHKNSTFCQREMGRDFSTYAMGLRAALRQAPKVILVGEIRDRETMEIALTAAETGHVVFSTLHTISAGQSINRVLGMFTKDEEKQVRERLAETLRWVVSQRLAPKVGGGRVMIPEIMGSNLRSRETIQLGENDARNYSDIIENARPEGWCTFEQTLTEAYEAGTITEETAMLLSVNKNRMRQQLDRANKVMGKDEATTESLKLSEAIVQSREPSVPGVGNGISPIPTGTVMAASPMGLKLKK